LKQRNGLGRIAIDTRPILVGNAEVNAARRLAVVTGF